jgi:plastocyanin
MKKLILPLLILITITVNSQTTWQVCVSEIQATGGTTCTHTATFTPANLNIAVGDKIEFTTFLLLLSGYSGTNHDIQFTGSSANNVLLPISSNILSPLTSVTTPAFNTPGTFAMECVDFNHCILATFPCQGYSVTVGTITEIEEERLKNEVRVYPNPTTGIINVNLLPIQNKNPKVYVMDIFGKIVATEENINTKTLTIDASSYQKGVYFVKIVSDEGNIIRKIIID